MAKKETGYQNKFSIFDNIPIGNIVLDCKGIIKYANNATLNFSGYSKEDLLGKMAIDFIMNANGRSADDILNIIRNNEGASIDVAVKNHDSSMKYFSAKISFEEPDLTLIFFEKANVTGNSKTKSIINDPSKNKSDLHEYETQLIKSEKRLKAAEIHARMGHWIWKVEEDEFIWSDGFYRMFGYETRHKKPELSTIWKVIHEDDAAEVKRKFANSLKNKEQLSMEIRCWHKDGHIFSIHVEGMVDETSDDRVTRMSGVATDISDTVKRIKDLENTFERLKLTEAMSHTGNWELDLETGMYTMSEELCRIHGFNWPIGEITAEEIRKTFHRDDAERIKRTIYNATKEGVGYSWAGRIIKTDGSIRHAEVSAVMIKNNRDIPVRVRGILADVTEKKAYEKILQNSEMKLKKAEEIAKVGNWTLNINTGEYQCSDGFYKLVNLDPNTDFKAYDEIIKLTHPDDMEMVEKAVKTSLKNGTDYDFENRLLLHDGTIKYVRSKGTYMRNDLGNPVISMGTLVDITEFKENENVLIESQQRLETTEAMSRTGNWEMDPKTSNYIFSDEVYRIFGIENDGTQYTTKSVYELFHPAQREKVYKVAKTAMNECRDFTFETVFIRPDGEHRFAKVSSQVILDADGKLEKVRGIISDVTDLKRSEQTVQQNEMQMKKAEEIANIGNFILDLGTMKFSGSDGFYKITGLSLKTEISLRELIGITHPDDGEIISDLIPEAVQSGNDYNFECRFILPEGDIRYVRARGTFIKDTDGKPIQSLGTLLDITEYKENENRILENQRRLARAEEMAKTGNWEMDMKTGVYNFSDEIFRIFGETNKDKIFKLSDILEYFAEDDRKRIADIISSAEKKSTDYSYEGKFIHKGTDEARYIKLYTQILFDCEGKPYKKRGIVSDITDFKINEMKLLEVQNRLVQAEAMAHTGNWERNIRTKEYILSDEASRIFGLETGGVTFSFDVISDRVHPDDRKMVFDTVDRAVKEKTDYSWEARIIRPDAEDRIVKASARMITDDSGNLIKIRGIMVDVTEARRAEQSLLRNQMQLKRAEDIAKLGSFIMDLNTKEYVCSEGYYKICGLNSKTEKMTFDMIGLLTHPDDVKRVGDIISHTMESGEDYDFENRLLLPNGQIKYIRTRGTYLQDANGNNTHSLGTILDITEYKTNEIHLIETSKRLSEAEAMSHTGNWEMDVETGVYEFSDEIYRIFGVEKTDSVYNTQKVYEFFMMDDTEGFHRYAADCIKEGRDFVFETYIKRPNEEIRYVTARAWMVKAKNGRVVKVRGIVSDITEKKEYEQILIESEMQLSKAEEIARMGNYIYDVNTRSFKGSDGFHRITGLDPADDNEIDFLVRITHPDDAERIKGILLSALQEGGDFNFESRIVIPDGSIRYIQSRGTYIKDANGDVLHSPRTIIDITELKEKEENLQQVMDRLSHAEALAHVGNWEQDLSTRMYTISEEACRLFGFENCREPIHVSELKRRFHPNDTERVFDKADNAFEKGEDYSWEARIIRPDKSIRIINARAQVIKDENGIPAKARGAMVDVTEARRYERTLQQSEMQLSKAEEIALLGNYVLNIETMEFTCSDGFYKVCGIDRHKKPDSFMDIMMMTHPEDYARIQEIMYKSIQNGEDYDIEFRLVTPDREIRHISAKGAYVRNDEGKVIKAQGTFLDISNYKETERNLNESRDRLLEAEKIAKIGHCDHEYENDIRYWSDGYYRLLGFEPGTITDYIQAMETVMGKEQLESLESQFIKGAKDRIQDFVTECYITTPSGEEKIIEYSARFYYVNDKPIREVVIAKDITESKLFEREILVKTERLSVAESTAGIGHFVNDENGEERFWSDELYRILELEPQSKEPNSFILRGMMGDIEYDKFISNFEESINRKEKEWHTEIKIVLPDGTRKTIDIIYVYEWINDRLSKYNGVFMDVSRTRQYENDLLIEKNNLAQAEKIAHVGHFSNNIKTGEWVWSDELYRILGLEPQSIIPNKSIFKTMLSRDDYSVFVRESTQSIRDHLDSWTTELMLTLPNGTENYISVIYNYEYNINGKLIGYNGIFKDITSERIYENQIINERNRLAAAESVASIGHFFVDTGSDEMFWSDEMYRIFDIEPQSVQANSGVMVDAMTPAVYNQFKKLRDSVIKARTTHWECEYMIKTVNGNVKYIKLIYNFKYPKSGKIRYSGIFGDITNEKLAQLELETKTNRLISAEALAKIGHFFNNNLTGERYWSDEMYRIFGLEPQSVQPNTDIFRQKMTGDEFDKFLNDFIASTHAENDEWESEIRLILPDGSVKYAWIKYYYDKTNKGKLTMTHGVIQDITATKQYEAELLKREQTLDNAEATAHIGHFEINVDKRIRFWSDEIFRIVGHAPGDFEVNYTSDESFVHSDDAERLHTAYRRAYETGDEYDENIRVVKKNGEEITVKIKGGLMLNIDGDRVISGTMEDITEIRKHYDEIEYMSYHDALTDLHNRHYFDKVFNELDNSQSYPISIIIADINGLKMINDTQGHKAGDEMLGQTARVLKSFASEGDVLARIGGDDFVLLLPNTIKSQAEIIINELHKEFAKLNPENPLSVSMGIAVKRNADENREDIIKKAEDNMYTNKLYEKSSKRGDLLRLIMDTLYERSSREELHSERVSRYCAELGKALKMPKHKVNELSALGLLHDIGKIAVRDSILNKNSELDEDELDEIRKHPEIGYRILNQAPGMQDAARYILAHHEFWNGRGYPQALESYEIPLQARVIAITDAYDAMRSKRSYKDSLPLEVAIRELKKSAGIQFDPELTKVFVTQVLGETW